MLKPHPMLEANIQHLNCACTLFPFIAYRIVGNFHMVQNFTVFADRSAAVKIRTANFSSASYGLLVGVVSPER